MSEPYTAEMAHTAVARGAAWLDRRYPEWFRAIDVYTLDLHSGDRCILGQTASALISGEDEAWGDTPYEAALNFFAPEAGNKWAARYGFNIPRILANAGWQRAEREYPIYYEMLTIAWRELIRQRLEVVS